ncbi:hypothetical protein JCM10212_000109 [Sporobolomyces blumeae]
MADPPPARLAWAPPLVVPVSGPSSSRPVPGVPSLSNPSRSSSSLSHLVPGRPSTASTSTSTTPSVSTTTATVTAMDPSTNRLAEPLSPTSPSTPASVNEAGSEQEEETGVFEGCFRMYPTEKEVHSRHYMICLSLGPSTIFSGSLVPVFEYTVGANKIMVDQESGYTLITSIWKALGRQKADVVRLIESQPTIAPVVRKIRGGILDIQGTWLPFEVSRKLAQRVAWPIRDDLIPLFGPSFPASCLAPGSPGFGDLVLSEPATSRSRRPRDPDRRARAKAAAAAAQNNSRISTMSQAHASRTSTTEDLVLMDDDEPTMTSPVASLPAPRRTYWPTFEDEEYERELHGGSNVSHRKWGGYGFPLRPSRTDVLFEPYRRRPYPPAPRTQSSSSSSSSYYSQLVSRYHDDPGPHPRYARNPSPPPPSIDRSSDPKHPRAPRRDYPSLSRASSSSIGLYPPVYPSSQRSVSAPHQLAHASPCHPYVRVASGTILPPRSSFSSYTPSFPLPIASLRSTIDPSESTTAAGSALTTTRSRSESFGYFDRSTSTATTHETASLSTTHETAPTPTGMSGGLASLLSVPDPSSPSSSSERIRTEDDRPDREPDSPRPTEPVEPGSA